MKATLRTKILALVLGAILPIAALGCLIAYKNWSDAIHLSNEVKTFQLALQADRAYGRFVTAFNEGLDTGKLTDAGRRNLGEAVASVGQLATHAGSGFGEAEQKQLATISTMVGEAKDVMSLYGTRAAIMNQGQALSERAQAAETRFVAQVSEQADSAMRDTRLMAVVSVVLVVGLFMVAWFVARALARPIERAAVFADNVSVGDLSRTIDLDAGGETGRLLTALHNMQENLGRIVHEVRGAANEIKSVSHDLAGDNRELSQRSDEQKRTIAAAADAVRDLQETVERNHASTDAATGLVGNAATVAETGSREISVAKGEIEGINDSSAKMVEIVEVINGIAFQTNILALNAAVEAARAGEQGKGFAVVATEVRSLSVRSADSARDIKELIADSLRRIGEGANKVGEINTSIAALVNLVHKVSAIMQDINHASSEQTRFIEAVNDAMRTIGSSASHNVTAADHAVRVVESLEAHAERLMELVSSFKLPGESVAAPEPGIDQTHQDALADGGWEGQTGAGRIAADGMRQAA